MSETTGHTTERAPKPKGRKHFRFYLGFGVVALLIAGLVSYLADSDPDGLDSVTLHGCTENADGSLRGDCIAQHATAHHMSGSPFADYSVNGASWSTGIAGVVGVLVVLAIAGGLFWLLRKRSTRPDQPE